MKEKRIYIVLTLFFFLFFSYLLQNNIDKFTQEIYHNNRRHELEEKNFMPISSSYKQVLFKWNLTWGGSDRDHGYCLAIDSFDYIYLAGSTRNFGAGNDDFFLVKLDSLGVQQWNLTWGGIEYDICNAIVLDSLNNIYLAGRTNSFGEGGYDICLVKFDSLGVQQWNLTWGGIDYESCSTITLDILNNIYLGGYTNSFGIGNEDVCLVKFDSLGVQQWNLTWGGIDDERCNAIALDSLSNIYLAGRTNSFGEGGYNMCLIKFDISGVLQWNLTWGEGFTSLCNSLAIDSSDNIYLGGLANEEQMCIVKYNSLGVQEWNHTYGEGRVQSIFIDTLYNIYLGGLIWGYGPGSTSMGIVKINNMGKPHWNFTWGGDYNDYCYAIAIDTLDNIYLAGLTNSYGAGNSDACLVKYHLLPQIIINSPKPNQIFGNKTIDFDLSITDKNLDKTWYSLNKGLNYTFSGNNGTINQSAWDLCENGTITIRFYANDTNGYIGFYEIKVQKDNKDPEIIINSPSPYQIFGKNTLNFEISIIEGNLNTTWYSLNNGVNITFSGTSGTIDQSSWDECGNGTVIIKFYANDTMGNMAFEEVIIRKDIIVPDIMINSPIIDQLYGNLSPTFNLSINDPNLDTIWYSLNDGINFTTSTLSGVINQAAWDTCGNGTTIIKFYANDTLGNKAFDQVTVRKNTHSPEIMIISPISNQLFGNKTPSFELSINEPSLNTTWYTINGKSIKYMFLGVSGVIDQSAWDECGNGTVTIRFYANNSLGNIGFKDIIVRKDIIGPQIIINSPSPYQLFGNKTFNFEISINEGNLNTTWYSLNGGDNYTFSGPSGTIDQSVWDEFGNGTVSILFYGNDTLGNIGFSKITVRKDIIVPVITIYSPSPYQLFGNRTFYFQLSIIEPNLNTTWYSLNGGDNYTFSGTNGNIDRTAWDMCDNGTVLLKFYANDYAGNIGIKEILIRKDVNFITYIDLTGSPIHIDNLDPNSNWLKVAAENEWCSGSGTINNPYIIEYIIIDGQNSDTCIYIENSDINFIIRDCILTNSGSSNSGIKMVNTINGYIFENYIHDNGCGIYLENSNRNFIQGNKFYNHQYSGIILYHSDNNQVFKNTFNRSSYAGIEIRDGSDYNTISGNNITNIEDYGLIIGGFSPKPQNNLIFQNNFTNNNQHVAISILYSNTKWDNGTIGNYWDDYQGFDFNGDNIGDKPYYVDIAYDEKDRFPIWPHDNFTFEWLITKDYGVWGLSDIGKAIAIDIDGYIYVTGTITVTTDNIVLLKYNSLGELQWERFWGGALMDGASGITIDSFGNIYIVGYTETSTNNEDILLIKYNSNGVLQWTRTWDGGLRDGAEKVTVDSFGNSYITGYTQTSTPNLYNMLLIKYNSEGTLQWEKTWSYASQSFGKAVSIDSSGNIFVGGFYYGGLGSNMFTIKYDNMGNYIWEIRWGIRAYNDVSDLVIDSQDNIYVAGTTWNSGANFDICFWKIGNVGGTPIYNRVYDRNLNSEGNGIVIDSFDNIFLVGSYGNDITLVKYDKFGNFQYHENWGENLKDIAYGIALNNYDNIFVCGSTESYADNGIDIFLLKYVEFPKYPYISINDGAETTNSTLVALTLSALYAEEMCFKNGTTGNWSEWEPYNSIKHLYLEGSINNTVYTILVKFRNSKGETISVNDSILLMKYLPKFPYISINDGAETTNSTLVALTLSALYAEEMCFKNGTTGNWSEWEPYNSIKHLYLEGSINNTVYTIYVKFRNGFGEINPISDDILYLVYPPSNPYIIINDGDLTFNTTSLYLTLSAINADEMCFKIGVSGTWTNWELYQTIKIININNPQNNTVYTIYVKFRNEFGETESISDEIIYLIKDYNNDQDETDNNNKELSISYGNFYIVIMSLTLFFSIIIIRKRKKIEM